jgi:hypothetical protein
MGGRVVKLRVHFKPEEKGYITWYLAVRRCPAEEAGNKKWTTPWLKLEDWKQLGILSLVLSEFCIKTRYMSKENFKKVQLLKRKWDKFVKHDFKKLNSIKRLIHEFQESY